MARWLLATVSAALALSVVAPGEAVVGGVPDGNEHPNVGIIVLYDAQGTQLGWCTATLVQPSTLLTAAHCVGGEDLGAPIARIRVDFDAQIAQAGDGTLVLPHPIDATGEPDPDFRDLTQDLHDFLADSAYDVGLVHLSVPASSVYAGIQPVALPAAGSSDGYAKGSDKTPVLQVGYGYDRAGTHGASAPFVSTTTRSQSQIRPRTVSDGLLFLKGNPNDANGFGSPCFGDSGSPVLRDGVEIAVASAVGSGCQNEVVATRIDAGPARAWLEMHGIVP